MDPERRQLIEAIFHEIIDLPYEKRREALETRCVGDPELLAELESLIEGDEVAENEKFLVLSGSRDDSPIKGGSRSRSNRPLSPGASVHVRCPNCKVASEILMPDVPERIICPACKHDIPRPLEGWAALARPFLGQDGKFARFQVIEHVGSGACGDVYKAFDPGLDRLVALKILRAGGEDRFLEDARSSALLRHPAIVSAHEVSQHDKMLYIVSDFIEGVTLAELIAARRPSFAETARILKVLAEALEFAHEKGVIHRDFKPTNVMIDTAGNPHLLDFGLAKREASEVTMTLDGVILGTPEYMSPEQARGDGNKVDGRGDIYSLGVVLYEMITGEKPFRGNWRTLLTQVLNDDPRPPRTLNDLIPRDLETICLRSMSKEPSGRYSKARDVAEDLENYLENRPINKRPIGPMERFWRWCRRNPRLASSLAATAASIILVAVLSVAFAINRGVMLAESNTRLAEVNFELGSAAFERGEIGPALHYLRRTVDAARAAGNAEWLRVGQANLNVWRREHPVLKGVFSHNGWVRRAKFSPDGKRVVTASQDGTARIWVVATNSILHELRHDDVVFNATFDPESKTIATASFDGTARLWDSATGQPRGAPMQHAGLVTWVIFSPDGKTVATASEDGTARLWDAETGKPRSEPLRHLGPVKAVAFNRDGTLLASSSTDKSVRFWLTSSGKPFGNPLQHDQSVLGVSFRPDGSQVVTTSEDQTARIWDVASGRVLKRFIHADQVYWAEFSPDGKTIATASWDQTGQLWDSETGNRRGEPLRHSGRVLSIEFSRDGSQVVTGSSDHTARVWNVADGAMIGRPFRHESEVEGASFSPDGSMLLTYSSDTAAKLWDLRSEQVRPRILPQAGKVRSSAMSPDGKTLIIGTEDGLAIECETATGLERGQFLVPEEPTAPRGRVTVITYRPDGEVVLIGDNQGVGRLWQVATRKPLGVPLKIAGGLTVAEFSPDGKSVLIGGNQGFFQIGDATSGRLLGNPIRHGQVIIAARFSLDGKTALTISGNDTDVMIWDAGTGASKGSLRHKRILGSLTLSPDGLTILTASYDGLAQLWDLQTGKARGQPLSHQSPVYFAFYTPDGKTVMTACQGGTVRLWDPETRKYRSGVGPLRHDSSVFAVGFNRDSQMIATATQNGIVRIWDLTLARPIGPPLSHNRTVHQVAFNPESNRLLTRADDNTARLWDLPQALDESDQNPAQIEAVTGLRLDPQGGIEVLDVETWNRRKLELRSNLERGR